MNKYISLLKICCIAIFVAAVMGACTKTETKTIFLEEPSAKFSVYVTSVAEGKQVLESTANIDSNFYFRNNSDDGSGISYNWDFGDGTASTEKNPVHSYTKRGTYTVTLTVNKDNQVSVKTQQQVRVILGQQHILIKNHPNLWPVAIEETADGEFVLFAKGNGVPGSFLIQLDTLMQQKSMKVLPANYVLKTMRATKDNNYIFVGSTKSVADGFELIKTKADGTELWKKELVAGDSYKLVEPTPDGGFAVLGTRYINNWPQSIQATVLIKTNGNGDVQWEQLFTDGDLLYPGGLVADEDGIVFSGSNEGPYPLFDSVQIAKVDYAGSVVWKSSVYAGMNVSLLLDTKLAKLSNGNYAVSNFNGNGVFIFEPSGAFIDRKLAESKVFAVEKSDAASFIVLQEYRKTFLQVQVSKIGLDGTVKWNHFADRWRKSESSVVCCFDSRPNQIKPLRKGGTITIGNAYKMFDGINSYDNSIILIQLDDDGNVL